MTTVRRDSHRKPSMRQEQVLLADPVHGGGTRFTTSEVLLVHDILESRLLRRALGRLMQRHELLHAGLRLTGDNLVPELVLDYTGSPDIRQAAEEGVGEFERLLNEALSEPFRLDHPPLWRCVVGYGDGHTFLGLVMHHTITDAWSFSLLLDDLAALYQGQMLPPPGPPYSEIAQDQRERVNLRTGELREYWTGVLEGVPAVCTFPGPGDRASGKGERTRVHMADGLSESVRTTALSMNASPFMLYLAAYSILLARARGQRDVVIGIPTANRTTPTELTTLGWFINRIPLRMRLAEPISLHDAIGVVRDAMLDGLEHQELPFHQIASIAETTPHHRTKFDLQTVAVQRDWEDRPQTFAGIKAERLEFYNGVAKCDIAMSFPANPVESWIGIEYDTGLYDRAFAQHLGNQFHNLLAELLSDPKRSVPVLASPSRIGEQID